MEDIWGDDGFDSVSNRVSKVDEVAQSSLLLVDRDNVRLGCDGRLDDGEEEGLGGGSSSESPTGVGEASGGSQDGRVDLLDARFELGKLICVPDGSSLSTCESVSVWEGSVNVAGYSP